MLVEEAGTKDIADVRHLLEENQLPLEGLEHVTTTLVARDDEQIIGSAALEVYLEGALLRSVAVKAAARGQGVARALCNEAMRVARERGVPAVYLLTTTAAGYFPQFGFQTISRQHVPPTVQSSVEFVSACPASATVMRKLLDPED